VFNGESFNELLARLFYILGIKKEGKLFAIRAPGNDKLICDNDEISPETYYQLIVVDLDEDMDRVAKFQGNPIPEPTEEPGSTRSRKGTSESRNRTYNGFHLNQ
jgi:hypothetical protein